MAQNDGYLIDGNRLKEKAVPLLFPTDMEPCGHLPEPVQAVAVAEIEGMLYREGVRLTHCQDCELWQRAEGQKIGKCRHFSRDDLKDFIKAITYMTNETDFCSSARRIVTDGNDFRG